MPVKMHQALSLPAVSVLLKLPNPSRELTFYLAFPAVLDITLYDMDGTCYPLVSGLRFKAGNNSIDLKGISATGIYLVTFSSSNIRKTYRILVLP
jgi:hypothetical protein